MLCRGRSLSLSLSHSRPPSALCRSGAFHTPLMEPASKLLQAALDATAVSFPEVVVYSNVTGLWPTARSLVCLVADKCLPAP